MEAKPQLKVKVVCMRLPGLRFENPYPSGKRVYEAIHLGIQKGKDVIEAVPANVRSVTFTPEFSVAKKGAGLSFGGPFAQGKPAERFFYLAWGEQKKAGRFEMFRRLKIFLHQLPEPKVERALKSGKPLTVKVNCTDEKGGPTCGMGHKTHVKWA